MVSYCDLPVANTVMVILQIMYMKMFPVNGLVSKFLSFQKITMCAFIVIGSSSKFCHGFTIILFSIDPTFYQIYNHFRITVKVFLHLIIFCCIFAFKSTCVFFCYCIIAYENFFYHMVSICLTH